MLTTDPWKLDAERRDFTINAMSMDKDGNIYDYFNGQEDLKNHFIRFVGNPEKRIEEDALRILRYFRFMNKFVGPQYNNESLKAIVDNAHLLKNVSVERIWSEIKQILIGHNAFIILRCMNLCNLIGANSVTQMPLDDLKQIDNIIHNNGGCDSPIVILASQCRTVEEAENIATLWKFSTEEKDELIWLVNTKYNTNSDDLIDWNNASKFMTIQQNENVNKKWVVHFGHLIGNYTIICNTNNQYKTFPIAGQDLIDIVQGKELGLKLKDLKQQWYNSNFTLTKEQLLKEV